MKKQIISFACALGFLTAASRVRAEETLFWTFDDFENKVTIPSECAQETNPEVLLDKGLLLLSQSDGTEMGAPYCLLSAAFLGNVEAQFAIAQLYYNGTNLPKNDIAAYKWALLSAVGGNKEADRLGAVLEKSLTPEDLALANKSLAQLVSEIQKVSEQKTEDLNSQISKAHEKLIAINKDIDDLEEFGMTAEEMPQLKPNEKGQGGENSLSSPSSSSPVSVGQGQIPTKSDSARPLRKNDKSQSMPIFNFQDVYRGGGSAEK
jgi:hypothetical protein